MQSIKHCGLWGLISSLLQFNKHGRINSYMFVLTLLFNMYLFHLRCPSLSFMPVKFVHFFQDSPSSRSLLWSILAHPGVSHFLSLNIYAYTVPGNPTSSCIFLFSSIQTGSSIHAVAFPSTYIKQQLPNGKRFIKANSLNKHIN